MNTQKIRTRKEIQRAAQSASSNAASGAGREVTIPDEDIGDVNLILEANHRQEQQLSMNNVRQGFTSKNRLSKKLTVMTNNSQGIEQINSERQGTNFQFPLASNYPQGNKEEVKT